MKTLVALTIVCCMISECSLYAHRVPRSEYDRNITVDVRPTSLRIRYRLEIDELTLVELVGDPKNKFPLDFSQVVGRKEFGDAFLQKMNQVIADQLIVQLNGKELPLSLKTSRVEYLDSAQFYFEFAADFKVTAEKNQIQIWDTTFSDCKGRYVLKSDYADQVEVVEVQEPGEIQLTGMDRENEKKFMCRVSIPLAAKVVSTDELQEPAPPSTFQADQATFWQLLREVNRTDNLQLLFDSRIGLWLILGVAFLHGCLHSISPGHGKTMVAAYLVGEKGTPKHALALGIVTTITHTSTAIGVALLLKFALKDVPPQTVQQVLGVGGGLLVAMIGVWLFLHRVAGKSDHVHGFASHSHSHAGDDSGHGHSHGITPEQFGRVSWIRLIFLGISGGLIPCWGAILWVLYCVTAHRYGLALWTVLSFSLGLAMVLVFIGLLVVWTARKSNQMVGKHLGWERFSQALSILGAVAVIAIGLFLCQQNLK
ncbi:MAG: hypothetical protein R3B84_09650 [Zavarzinella sp.]